MVRDGQVRDLCSLKVRLVLWLPSSCFSNSQMAPFSDYRVCWVPLH